MNNFELTVITLVFSLPVIIELLSIFLKAKIRGSDHYFHFMLIDEIKNNKHRFIKDYKYFIGNNKVFYPQLLHWMLAKFKSKNLEKVLPFFNVFFYALGSIFFFVFLTVIWKYYHLSDTLDPFNYYLFAGSLTIFTPYTFHLKNAKNSGLSSRAMGLILGQVYVYSLILFQIQGNPWILVISTIIVVLILTASIFATQFVLFFTPLLAIAYFNFWVLIPVVVGTLIFLLLLGEIASQFITGQFRHKVYYHKYLAHRFILKQRYSIYRDWVYDFWRMAYSYLNGKEKLNFLYVYENALFIVLLMVPLIPTIGITSLTTQLNWAPETILLLKPISIAIFIFLLTSFRSTRFLGEPERYVEFVIPILALLAVLVLSYNILLAVLVYGVLFSLGQILLGFLVNKSGSSQYVMDEQLLQPAIRIIKQHEEPRLLCNDMQMNKVFFPLKIPIFRYALQYDNIHNFHMTEIFKRSYSFIEPKYVELLSDKFEINHILINLNYIDEAEKFWLNNAKYEVIWQENHFLLLSRH